MTSPTHGPFNIVGGGTQLTMIVTADGSHVARLHPDWITSHDAEEVWANALLLKSALNQPGEEATYTIPQLQKLIAAAAWNLDYEQFCEKAGLDPWRGTTLSPSSTPIGPSWDKFMAFTSLAKSLAALDGLLERIVT